MIYAWRVCHEQMLVDEGDLEADSIEEAIEDASRALTEMVISAATAYRSGDVLTIDLEQGGQIVWQGTIAVEESAS